MEYQGKVSACVASILFRCLFMYQLIHSKADSLLMALEAVEDGPSVRAPHSHKRPGCWLKPGSVLAVTPTGE